ncbi:hypothetical protein [Paraburkholderia humisilvae]|nr:hypothetical protein [Paraburkholderia humisilvae]
MNVFNNSNPSITRPATSVTAGAAREAQRGLTPPAGAQNFSGRSPYVGSGLHTPLSSPSGPSATSPEIQAIRAPSPETSPAHPRSSDYDWRMIAHVFGSQSQVQDLARKALVDRAYREQAREQRAPAVDVAVIADINKRALNIRYDRTFEQNGHSGSSGYITKDGFTAAQKIYVEKKYADEDWRRRVNDDNP